MKQLALDLLIAVMLVIAIVVIVMMIIPAAHAAFHPAAKETATVLASMAWAAPIDSLPVPTCWGRGWVITAGAIGVVVGANVGAVVLALFVAGGRHD
jgi:hypothetical protein